jgi:hypothetical protein
MCAMNSRDSIGNEVFIGDSIKILEVDERITEYLPEYEKEELTLFIGNIFVIEKINSDGSMLVSKTWHYPNIDSVMGHDIAIFPIGALLVGRA